MSWRKMWEEDEEALLTPEKFSAGAYA